MNMTLVVDFLILNPFLIKNIQQQSFYTKRIATLKKCQYTLDQITNNQRLFVSWLGFKNLLNFAWLTHRDFQQLPFKSFWVRSMLWYPVITPSEVQYATTSWCINENKKAKVEYLNYGQLDRWDFWIGYTKLVTFLHKIFDIFLSPYVMDVRKLSKIVFLLNNVYIQR